MGKASHSPDKFLLQLSSELLEKYNELHGINFDFKQRTLSEDVIENFLYHLESLPEDTNKKFWLNLYDIDDIGVPNGCDYLLSLANNALIKLDKEYELLTNNKQRALFFYLNHRGIFDMSFSDYRLEKLQGWKTTIAPNKDIKSVIKNIPDLQAALKVLYKEEKRGKNLTIKHNKRDERLALTAYIEDVLTNDVVFEKGNIELHMPRRPVLEVFFIYRPEEGLLEVKSKGGKERIKTLQRIFLDQALKSPDWEISPERFDFKPLEDLSNFKFSIQNTDGIESIKLKSMTFLNLSLNRSITIHVNSKDKKDSEEIQAAMKYYNINPQFHSVVHCKIEFIFKKKPNERRKKVTVELRKPNSCNLMERPQDLKVRELLKRWKIDKH